MSAPQGFILGPLLFTVCIYLNFLFAWCWCHIFMLIMHGFSVPIEIIVSTIALMRDSQPVGRTPPGGRDKTKGGCEYIEKK